MIMDSNFLQGLDAKEKLEKLPTYIMLLQQMLREEQEKNKYKSFIVDVCRDCGWGGSCKKGYIYHPRAFMKAQSLDDIRKKFVIDTLYILKNNGRRPEEIEYDDYDDFVFYFRHQGGSFSINKIDYHVSPYVVVLREFFKCVFDWDDRVFELESSEEYNIPGNLAGVPIWINLEELKETAKHFVWGDEYYVELVGCT